MIQTLPTICSPGQRLGTLSLPLAPGSLSLLSHSPPALSVSPFPPPSSRPQQFRPHLLHPDPSSPARRLSLQPFAPASGLLLHLELPLHFPCSLLLWLPSTLRAKSQPLSLAFEILHSVAQALSCHHSPVSLASFVLAQLLACSYIPDKLGSFLPWAFATACSPFLSHLPPWGLSLPCLA